LLLLVLASRAAAQAPYLVKDVDPSVGEPFALSPSSFADLGDVLLFSGCRWNGQGSGNCELWRTDGTAVGTRLVKDILPGERSSGVAGLTKVGNRVMFGAAGEDRAEIWKTDGTAEGTEFVWDPYPNATWRPSLGAAGETLFFQGYDPAHGEELWKTDGTAAGTLLVADIQAGVVGSYPRTPMVDLHGLLLFDADDGAHVGALWRSDGTPSGTFMLHEGQPRGVGSRVVMGGFGYFVVRETHPTGSLWKTDGTVAGTSRVFNFSGEPSALVAAGGTLFVAAGGQLWRSDGTDSGNTMVKDFGASLLFDLTNAAGRVYFTASNPSGGRDLWGSDGTPAGTVLLKATGSAFPGGLTTVNERLFFALDDGAHGSELWKSDGSAADTTMIVDATPGAMGSTLGSFKSFAGLLYFSLDQSLWRSDGTAAGTRPVRPGPRSSHPGEMVDIGGIVYFSAHHNEFGHEVWRSDGTPSGTFLLKDIDPTPVPSYASPSRRLTNQSGTLLFAIDDGVHGEEMWRSSGTADQTELLKDIQPGAGSAAPTRAVAVGLVSFFSADDGVHGNELWKTDGTEGGTELVKDVDPGPADSFPRALTDAGGTLFFVASGLNAGLWRSDGTSLGTSLVYPQVSFPNSLTALAGAVYFANNGASGVELWKSDGTPSGTSMVEDINPGPLGSSPDHLTAWNGRVYFAAHDDTHQIELWKSDGTSAGTSMVRDINPAGHSSPRLLTSAAGDLYFAADDGAHGVELWKTDGTAAGTVLVKDVNPAGSSRPEGLTAAGTLLYFTADDGQHGRELWRTDGTAGGTQMVGDIDPLGGSAVMFDLGPPTFSAGRLLFAARNDTWGTELWAVDVQEIIKDLALHAINPCRLVDTRDADGPALSGSTTRVVAVAGRCGIPPSALALSLNVTVTQSDASGHVRLFPAGRPLPLASVVNYSAGQTRANNTVSQLNPRGEIAVFASQAEGTKVHFIMDVLGYFE
jgi:ELWxxDGT repeat protein